jgi:predicted Zn-dependent protease
MQKNWGEAGAAYAKVFALAPSADVAFRAAGALRRAGTDGRRAVHFGEEAVKLDPNKAVYHLALALTYIDAGLLVRARGELDRGQALDPKHPLIREVLAKLGLR